MNDELSELLKRNRPLPPPAPAGEWEAIAARTVHAPGLWRRLRLPFIALGGAAALASAALVLMPGGDAQVLENAMMESYFSEAGQVLRPQAAPEAGGAYLELLESIE